MANWKDGLPLKIVNVATYLIFLGANGYGALGPNSAKWGAGAQETFMTPDSWLFGIWGFIHFLLLGFIIYQFHPAGYKPVIEGVGWRFPILAVLNSVYATVSSLSAKHHKTERVWAILAFVVMLLIAGTVSTVFHTLKTGHKSQNLFDSFVVHLPFSLWHGLSVVLAVVAAFAAFGKDAHNSKPGIISDILVFLGLLFLEGTSAGYALYGEGDIASGAVISLALLAIFQHQTPGTANRFIHWSALIFFLLSLLAVVRSLFAIIQGRRAVAEGENAPLLG